MKLFVCLLCMIFVTSALASQQLELSCHEKGEFVLSASVEIKDKENFEIELMSRDGMIIPVTSKWIVLDEKGEPESITTSGGWENFRVERINSDLWKGEYWYDNSPYYVECVSKNAKELKLTCRSQYLRDISVHVTIRSKEDYEVKLENFNFANWNVDREEVVFDEAGEVVKIEKVAFFEQFSIQKTDSTWSGLYVYDLGYYPLNCGVME